MFFKKIFMPHATETFGLKNRAPGPSEWHYSVWGSTLTPPVRISYDSIIKVVATILLILYNIVILYHYY